MLSNTTYVIFGDGDVVQQGGLSVEGHPVILIKHSYHTNEPGPLKKLPEDFDFDRPDVLLGFKDIPALDRFIDYLKQLKKYAEEQKNDNSTDESSGS